MTHWHTLPGPAQVALAWAVNIGGPTGDAHGIPFPKATP